MLEILGLTKQYPGESEPALAGIDLTVRPGNSWRFWAAAERANRR
ncbi:hypothetical protein N6H14_33385 [Paenibacillus sp. CC-CFT747]|nr:hypothetical protein N6H14_33385 [Paenibacillus sp. CC-CFT747]